MNRETLVAAIVSLVLLAATGAGAWYLLRKKPGIYTNWTGAKLALCPLSGREIHAQTRALVTIGGRKYQTCCVRCGITEAQQTGQPLRVLEVADFETGKLLDPDKAWIVEGSPVNLCMSMSPGAASPDRQEVYLRGFDRCAPSIMAFSGEQRARAFIAQPGVVLKRLDELERESKVTPAGVKPQ